MNRFTTRTECSFISVVFQNVQGPCVLKMYKEQEEYKALAQSKPTGQTAGPEAIKV